MFANLFNDFVYCAARYFVCTGFASFAKKPTCSFVVWSTVLCVPRIYTICKLDREGTMLLDLGFGPLFRASFQMYAIGNVRLIYTTLPSARQSINQPINQSINQYHLRDDLKKYINQQINQSTNQ